jgi:hypothetical protein
VGEFGGGVWGDEGGGGIAESVKGEEEQVCDMGRTRKDVDVRQ